jgi:glycosyltransferase involved in cell wall biosynthesis
VLPNGVDVARFRTDARAPEADLVYTGSLDGWKGVDVLIDALARLDGVRLRIAGFGEPEVVESILARARERGVADRLEFLGYRPHHEIPELLASARVIIVSTSGRYREGRDFTCPMKLLEAFAAGRPVVATDLPSIRALLTHEREGLLFRDDDPDSLATAVRRLLGDRPLADRLVAAARARVEEFTWEARARRLVGFLERLARS